MRGYCRFKIRLSGSPTRRGAARASPENRAGIQPQFYLDGPAAPGPERMEEGAAQWILVPCSSSLLIGV